MNSVRLQHLQWGAGLAAALCCLALGTMSLVSSIHESRRVHSGIEAFDRFEIVSDMVNAIVAERLPASRLIAMGTFQRERVEAVETARAETDRLIELVGKNIVVHSDAPGDALYVLNETRASLVAGRLLADAFARLETAQRTTSDFRKAAQAMFGAATMSESLRESFGQRVIAITPEITAEVFLGFAIGGLRDQAGRLGHLATLASRENRTVQATLDNLQTVVGRLESNNRVLGSLLRALPKGEWFAPRLAQVQRLYYEAALPAAHRFAKGELNDVEFAAYYAPGLSAIDGLMEAIGDSSRDRLNAVADAAFNRAAVTATLTGLACLILLMTVLVFRRALFDPLGRAREQAIAIARGDLSEPSVGGRVGGEVGDMLAGLGAIRGDQRWRRELEEQQSEMARQLKRLSETDMLTGLLNRRAMEEFATGHVAEADRTGVTLALILFDVDHFKEINDTFGHGAGDEVLRAIAREMASLLRPEDLFARFGGEEFLMLLPNVDADRAGAIAESLRSRFPEAIRLPGEDRRITASFGLVLREPGSGATWEAVVATADRRLYAAKRGGRDRICASDEPIAYNAAVA